MSPRLSGDVDGAITLNHFSTKHILTRQVNDELRPSLDVQTSICELEGEVPHDSLVLSRRLETMLRDTSLKPF